jgi:hypothetical protein
MEQSIQESIVERFERFVKNNETWFGKLKYDNVVNIREVKASGLSHATDIKKAPFCVTYVAKLGLGAGMWYIFLDDYLDKIYNMFVGVPRGQE